MKKIEITKISPVETATEKLMFLINELKAKNIKMLPSERDLASSWNISRSTVRRAINDLKYRGYIYIQEGIGTFISDDKINRNLQNLESMTESISSKGLKVTTKVLSARYIISDKNISEKLNVPLDSIVFELIRLRSVNGVPTQIETNYLAQDYIKDLDTFDFNKESLYRVLKDQYNVLPTHGSEKISVTFLTKEESYYLNCEEDTSAFFVSGITKDKYDRHIEYYKIILKKGMYYLTSSFYKEGEGENE